MHESLESKELAVAEKANIDFYTFGELVLNCRRFDRVLNALDYQSLLHAYKDGELDWDRSPLPWAVIAVGALLDPDPAIRSQGSQWAEAAQRRFNVLARSMKNVDETLAASVWIVMYNFVTAQGTPALLDLAQALRLARIVGYDTLDSKHLARSSLLTHPHDPRAKMLILGRRRRTIYALMMLENIFGSVTGWGISNINDRMDVHTAEHAWNNDDDKNTMSRVQYLYELVQETFVMLGKVLAIRDAKDREENLHGVADERLVETTQACEELIQSMGEKTLLLFPMLDDASHSSTMAIWLIVMPGFCKILLDQPGANCGSHSFTANEKCGRAAHIITRHLVRAKSISISILQNPLLGPVFYLVCRILVLDWRLRGNREAQVRIYEVLDMMGRASIGWEALALKYKSSILYDMARSDEQLEEIRVWRGTYAGSECGL